MYRYREPRTLRTVFYDAGHLGGLIEALCNDQATVAHGHHGFNDTFLNGLLKVETVAQESALYLVSVGLRQEMKTNSRIVGTSRLEEH